MNRIATACRCLAYLVLWSGCAGAWAQGQGVSVARPTLPEGAVPDVPPPEAGARAARAVSPERVRAIVDRLAAFGTRHTLSETEGDARGIGASRRWIKAEFERTARESGRAGDRAMRVEFDGYTQEPDGRRIDRAVEIVNVVAVLPGSMPEARDRLYYVVGHYDSRASGANDATSDAPGANDNASGTAVVMELARVLSTFDLDATVVFLATAGEEQGLFGARHHAAAARARNADIRGVLNNDIVGDPSAGAPDERGLIRVFSEGVGRSLAPEALAELRTLGAESDGASRQLARFVAEVAAWHAGRDGLDVAPMLVFRADRFLRGGDHSAFNENGYAGVRFTTVSEDYARQHQDVRTENGIAYGDAASFVDERYLAGVARLNGVALVHLANAPREPARARIITAELERRTRLRWDACPEPDVAGYEIVWRRTTDPLWTGVVDAGLATEGVVGISKDDAIFGVRAYDREGYRSPVSACRAARE